MQGNIRGALSTLRQVRGRKSNVKAINTVGRDKQVVPQRRSAKHQSGGSHEAHLAAVPRCKNTQRKWSMLQPQVPYNRFLAHTCIYPRASFAITWLAVAAPPGGPGQPGRLQLRIRSPWLGTERQTHIL